MTGIVDDHRRGRECRREVVHRRGWEHRGQHDPFIERLASGPELLLIEVANLCWKKQIRREISSDQALDIIRNLPAMFDLVRPTADLAARALEIALEIEHPVHDCVYLALAESEDAVVTTDDRRLHAKVADTAWSTRVRLLRP